MAPPGGKKGRKAATSKGEAAGRAPGAEIPSKATIVAEKALVTSKQRYTILETNQTDPYDAEKPPAGGDRKGKL